MKKKLCLVIPSLNAGGMERVMSELAGYFSLKPELEVHLVMYGIKPELFYPIPSNISIHKPTFIFNNKFRIWFTIRTMFYLRKEIKKLSPDSILSFGEYWNNFVLLALFGMKFPVFVSDRCQPDKSLGKFHNTLRKYLYPGAAGVIVQTQIAKKIYQKIIPGAKLKVISNPIRKINTDTTVVKENIVLSVGRLISSKHHDELIKLFASIKVPDWKLVIVGGDAIKQKNFDKLQNLIRELNVEDRILLTGTRNDVDLFYCKSKIFAFTSSSEGFPNAIGEAMSAGVPVVAFDCIAGPAEIIKNKINGILIELFDYDSFKCELQRLIEDQTIRFKLASNCKKGIEKYSIDKISKDYLKVLMK